MITKFPRNAPMRPPLSDESIRYDGVRYPGPVRFVKSVILEFLKSVFEKFPDENYLFNEDINKTKLVIHDKLTFNLDKVDKRPALVTERDTLYSSKGQTGIDRTVRLEKQFETDTKVKTDIFRGNITIQCYGLSQTLQSEELADLVFMIFNTLDVALRHIGFMSIYATAIGREVPTVSTSKVEYIVTPVLVTYQIQRNWSIGGNNYRKLKEIIDKFNLK
jgi:hypothetical protein